MTATRPSARLRARQAAARLLTRAAARLAPPPQRILLIDLENFGVQPDTRPIRVLTVLDAIIAEAGPVDLALVAAPHKYETLRTVIESRGIALHTCPAGRDAADLELHRHASAHPTAALVIASGDRTFAQLAAAGRVEKVIALRRNLVAGQLADRAPTIACLLTG